jgi:hypothetical protein
LLEESGKENHHLPRGFDINHRVNLVGKFLLLHHSAFRILKTGILKSRIATIATVASIPTCFHVIQSKISPSMV